MTPLIGFLLQVLFVFSVIFIWLMLLYQFILCVGGYLFFRKNRSLEAEDMCQEELPTVSILIPAHNEEKVISGLLKRILDLKYPKEKVEVIVINDNSTDNTANIVTHWTQKNRKIRMVDMPENGYGTGKAAALNLGLRNAAHEVIAVYDADNWPERESLFRLCHALAGNKKLAAVTGKFRAYNKGKNLLTKMINIESIAFQWIIQAGRWNFLRISFLPGTNFVIWKSLLDELGGWDKMALTEDTELTFRIYKRGYHIRFLPSATSWEQEPEKLSTWIKQRTRWARGNLYIISRHRKKIFHKKARRTALEMINLLYLYYLFIFAIIISDILFLLSLFQIIVIRMPGPFLELWVLAFLLFMLEILLALSYEREETFLSPVLIFLAYLIYTKMWVFVVLRSLFHEYLQKKEKIWVKTERFDSIDYKNICH